MFKSKLVKSLRNQASIVFNARILSTLKPAEAYEFLQLCHKRTYKPGEYIYYQNDPGNGLYILEEGRVELIIQDTDGTQIGETFIIDPPDSFGNSGLSYEMKRMSSARAMSETSVLGFFEPDLEILQRRQPSIAIKMMRQFNRELGRQLEFSLKKLTELSSQPEVSRLYLESYYSEKED